MTRKKKLPIENLLLGWNKIRHIMDPYQSNVFARTEKYILSKYKENDEIMKSFLKIRDDWYSVDFHPHELGKYEEEEKWEACRKEMIELLEKIKSSLEKVT